jgi:hypothetical protein
MSADARSHQRRYGRERERDKIWLVFHTLPSRANLLLNGQSGVVMRNARTAQSLSPPSHMWSDPPKHKLEIDPRFSRRLLPKWAVLAHVPYRSSFWRSLGRNLLRRPPRPSLAPNQTHLSHLFLWMLSWEYGKAAGPVGDLRTEGADTEAMRRANSPGRKEKRGGIPRKRKGTVATSQSTQRFLFPSSMHYGPLPLSSINSAGNFAT